MKLQNISLVFVSLFFIVLLTSFVSSFNVNYPVYGAIVEDNLSLTTTLIPVNDLTVIGYRCLNLACTNIDTANPEVGLSAHVTNNIVPVIFPVSYNANGYILYFYKSGYIGWAQKDNAWGTGSATGVNIYLSKKRNAGAEIYNFIPNMFSGITSATIDSAIKTTEFASIPLLEKVYTVVNFKINNTQTGQVINTNVPPQNFLIPYSLTQNVNFTYNFSQLSPGNYTVTISTDVSEEDKIINPIVYSKSYNIVVYDNGVDVPLPELTIISPIHKTYNTTLILINITATNFESIWFTVNDELEEYYSTPNLFNFETNGSYFLQVYANNSRGDIVQKNVTFIINTSDNGSSIALPTIQILSPNQNYYNTTLIPLNFNVTNYQAIWFNFNNGVNYSYSASGVFDVLDNGTYILRAYANNTLGNIVSANWIFNVNTSLNDTTSLIIGNITTNPNINDTSNHINNGTSQNISVNFTSNRYPLNLTFHLYNSSWNLNNTQGPIYIANVSQLPVIYIIPANLTNGWYFLNMTIEDSLGNTGVYYVGRFLVNRTSNQTDYDDDDDDSDDGNDYYNYLQAQRFANLSSNETYSTIVFNSEKSENMFWKIVLYWLLILILILLIIIVLVMIARIAGN